MDGRPAQNISSLFASKAAFRLHSVVQASFVDTLAGAGTLPVTTCHVPDSLLHDGGVGPELQVPLWATGWIFLFRR